jgi:murein DD-endopeptidase MepM/ murein hydrolase activator NlpD
VVSSSFGYRVHPTDGEIRFHYGTDIAADSGEQITAFADGKTIDVGTSDSLGNYVILRHGSIETQYAHCCEVYVQCGQAVKKGQAIAAVGATGDATNPHLHFELRVSGIYVNPEYYLTW